MAERSHVLISNLPTDSSLSPAMIKDVLSQHFDNQDIEVTLYEQHASRGAQQRFAVISGLSISVREWAVLKSTRIQVDGRRVILHTDFGEPRNGQGLLVNKMEPSFKRHLTGSLFGESTRKVLPIFRQEFLQKMKSFDVMSDRIIIDRNWRSGDFFNTPEVQEEELMENDKINFRIFQVLNFVGSLLEIRGSNYKTIVQFGYKLDLLQAIRYLNQSSFLEGARFVSYEPNDRSFRTIKHASTCSDGLGLGAQGEVIFLDNYVKEFGCVPISELDPTILDEGLSSVCWICEDAFKIIGLDANLDFIAAQCSCLYGQNPPTAGSEILGTGRPVTWDNEAFTRLVLPPYHNQDENTTLLVAHRPMKIKYSNCLNYAEIILPILKEEWKYEKMKYEGKSIVIERPNFCWTQVGEAGHNKEFVLQMLVLQTEFWNSENFMQLSGVTIIGGSRFGKRKGRIVEVISSEDQADMVEVFVRLTCPFPETEEITVIPKPSKTEYNTNKRLVKEFADGEINANQIPSFLGLGSPPTVEFGLVLPRSKRIERDIIELLTPSQKNAVLAAQKSAMTVIQGPPGTGKSTTVAALSCILAEKERGRKLLICAPTNVACDVVAARVMQFAETVDLPISVLRMLSTRQQRKYQSSPPEDSEWGYSLLHKMIEENDAVNAKLAQLNVTPHGPRRSWELPTQDKTELEVLIAQEEKKLMMKHDIIIATLGCAADNRLAALTEHIQTIIVDESGQAFEPSVLSVLQFDPARLILAGDHLQLSPKASSTASFIAGYERSILERFEFLNRITGSKIPWITLLEQHRMVASLREITSKVFYEGILKDGDTVLNRQMPTYWTHVLQAYPSLINGPVMFFDHGCAEEKYGTSYFNIAEVDEIIESAKKLVLAGAPANEIACCTMYESQREIISTKLKELGIPFTEIECRNVDGYQGREKDIILLSLVRSNNTNSLGFAVDAHRLNVAFSRARYGLFLFGNLRMLENSRNQVIRSLYQCLSNFM